MNFEARDDSALGRFWAEALGWGLSSEGPGATNLEPMGFDWPASSAVCVDLVPVPVPVPAPETVKYRVHIELATTSDAHRAELVARLKELGATAAEVGQGDVPWTGMTDPEGNEFCVLGRGGAPIRLVKEIGLRCEGAAGRMTGWLVCCG
ncbi:VOC family protein, partial [Streptomyces sp. NPDC058686]|uniref:VOC family protein n=1 Tax=Streptomyces sp. NPDC058686 TaxID=3346599 RepID=UPI00365E387E